MLALVIPFQKSHVFATTHRAHRAQVTGVRTKMFTVLLCKVACMCDGHVGSRRGSSLVGSNMCFLYKLYELLATVSRLSWQYACVVIVQKDVPFFFSFGGRVEAISIRLLMLVGAKGIATSNKKLLGTLLALLLGARMLLGAPGIATRRILTTNATNRRFGLSSLQGGRFRSRCSTSERKVFDLGISGSERGCIWGTTNKCIAIRNRCIATRSKKPLVALLFLVRHMFDSPNMSPGGAGISNRAISGDPD